VSISLLVAFQYLLSCKEQKLDLEPSEAQSDEN
jgi:hypothetical protein